MTKKSQVSDRAIILFLLTVKGTTSLSVITLNCRNLTTNLCCCCCVYYRKTKPTLLFAFFLSAFCEEGCRSGGTCVSPNTCVCPSGFTGRRCETGKALGTLLDSLHVQHIQMFQPINTQMELHVVFSLPRVSVMTSDKGSPGQS